MKIYTRTGDDGSTGLIGGARLAKNDPRIECYGTVDELNSSIGLAAVAADPSMRPPLLAVQNHLFVIGSHLATEDPAAANLPALHEALVSQLEKQIDAAESVLAPLRQFILPGGCEAAARLHLARTICRRAERLAVSLPAQPLIVVYLNRLSDWLFVQARLANHLAGTPDVPWEKQP